MKKGVIQGVGIFFILTVGFLAWFSTPSHVRQFAKLRELGLPQVDGSQYVLVAGFDALHQSYDGEGNAWLVAEHANGEHEFVINGCERVRVFDKSVLARLRMPERPFWGADNSTYYSVTDSGSFADRRYGAEWIPVDLAADVQRVVANLESPDLARIDPEDSVEWLARTFLFAAQISELGYAEEARHMVGKLAGLGGRRRVFSEAISLLADGQYTELGRSFLVRGDEQVFQQALAALKEKFGSRWKHRAFAGRQLDAMAASGTTGKTLHPSERAFLEGLDQWRWLPRFDALWSLRNRQPPPLLRAEDRDAFYELLARRQEALPFLVDLLTDYSPTALSMHDFQGFYDFGHFETTGWYHHDPMLMRTTMDIDDLLARPVTRAEVARKMLAQEFQFSPEQEDEISELQFFHDGDTYEIFERFARQWLLEHQAMSLEQLREEFLAKPGNRLEMLCEPPTAEELAEIYRPKPRSVASVSEDVIAGLKGADVQECQRIISSLSPAERLGVAKYISTDVEMNARLHPIANRVVACQVDGVVSVADQQFVENLKGRAIDLDLFLELVELARREVKLGRMVDVQVVRKSAFEGVQVVVSSTGIRDGQMSIPGRSEIELRVSLSRGMRRFARLPVEVADSVVDAVNRLRYSDEKLVEIQRLRNRSSCTPEVDESSATRRLELQILSRSLELFFSAEDPVGVEQSISVGGDVGWWK